MPSLHLSPCARWIALLACALAGPAAACGSPSSDSEGASPTSAAPSTTPTSTGTVPPPGNPPPATDGGADGDAGSFDPTRCGATPYRWLPTATMGDVLENASKASHSILELNYAIIKAKQDGAFKTRRLSKLGTKSSLVRYQTQDRGKPVDATALIAYPDVSGSKTYPILLVLHGTTGFTDGCGPSMGAAGDALGGFTDGPSVLLSLFASFGYIAVGPDYIGLKSLGAPTGFLHPYLVAEPTAIASLDAVRAAKKLLAGSSVTPGDLVVVGGSQGGHAAAFVNRYVPHYAPEFTVKGSVWDVPPTDLLGQIQPALTTWKNATKNAVAFAATFESWYQAAPGGLSSALQAPYATTVPAAMAASCSPGDAFAGATLDTMFTPGLLAAGRTPGFGGLSPWACYLAENSLPTTSIPRLDATPSMFLLGQNDELVDNVVERASFQKLCTQGHELSFLECAGATHTKPLSYAFDQWFDFLEDRLAGKPVTGACAIRPAETCTSTP